VLSKFDWAIALGLWTGVIVVAAVFYKPVSQKQQVGCTDSVTVLATKDGNRIECPHDKILDVKNIPGSTDFLVYCTCDPWDRDMAQAFAVLLPDAGVSAP
jgi:hypothetical protein